jgi:MinD-like ATPase involved in chromosome partitioning or flagellar assembly
MNIEIVIWSADQNFVVAFDRAAKNLTDRLGTSMGFSVVAVANSQAQFFGQVDTYKPKCALIDARTLTLSSTQDAAALAAKLWAAYTESNPAMITRVIKHPGMVGLYDTLVTRENNGIRVITVQSFDAQFAENYLMSLIGEYSAALNDLVSGVVTRTTPITYSPNANNTIPWERKTIACWSIKGGVGKSTLVKEIATILAVLCGRRVIILDLDMNCGSIANIMPAPERIERNIYTLSQVFANNGCKLNQESVNLHIYQITYPTHPHQPISVIYGLTNGLQSGSQGLVGENGLKFCSELLEIVRNMQYDFVICDVGQRIAESVHMVALQRANAVLAILTSELSTTTEMSNTLTTMQNFPQYYGSIPDRFFVVFNNWLDDHGIKREQVVQKILRLPEMGCVPADVEGKITLCNNFRESYVLKYQHTPTAQAILDLAKKIYPPLSYSQSEKADGGLFGRFFGKKSK